MARILHVEDDQAWRTLIKGRLRGHHVDSAASLEEAVDLLEAGLDYDVAIVDLNLKNDSDGLGGDVLDILRARHPFTRRIIVTGSPPGGSLRRNIFERFDVDEIIIKRNVEVRDLRRVVEEAIADGPSGLSQPLRLRRSSLRQRFRDWQRIQGDRLRGEIRVAEEHVYDAGKVSGQSRRRAQPALDEARQREEEFRSACDQLRQVMESIDTVDRLNAAIEALDAAEERFGGVSVDNETGDENP